MSASSSRPPLTVLIVDPDRRRSELFAEAIRATSRVAMSPSAKLAMDVLLSQPPDLLVTEMDLPDAHGVDFIRRIHSDPRTKDVLIMVVTSHASVRDKVAALVAGADDFLVRPVSPEKFAIKVRLLGRFRRIVGR
jgi:two-component system phosphate regulon response regulator PhoB